MSKNTENKIKTHEMSKNKQNKDHESACMM